MIQTYHRPDTLEEALSLLTSADGINIPLGGGSVISQLKESDFGVVDLQRLGLDQIEPQGNLLVIGATVTLEQLRVHAHTPPGLKTALEKEVSTNLRNQATVAGALISADGRSPFAAAMAALDAEMTWLPGNVVINYGDWVSIRESPGKLMTAVKIPINTSFSLESVARTPVDRPIVLVAVNRWPSGRVRIVVGGTANSPVLAMDGQDAKGAELAVRNAFSDAADRWASAEYRQDAAVRLVSRILKSGMALPGEV